MHAQGFAPMFKQRQPDALCAIVLTHRNVSLPLYFLSEGGMHYQ